MSQGDRQCELPLDWFSPRSRWSLNIVKNFMFFRIRNTWKHSR
jgi:hypothetical protein